MHKKSFLISFLIMLNLASFSCASKKTSTVSTFKVHQDTALPRFGYMLRDKKMIVPAKYFSIHECRDGTLLAGEFDIKNPEMSPSQIKVFDKSGNPLSFNLPRGCSASAVIDDYVVIKRNTKKDSDQAVSVLKGLCDKSGKIILEPQFFQIWTDGDCIIAMNSSFTTVMFDMNGKVIVDLGQYSYLNEDFLKYNPNYYSFQSSNGWIVVDRTGKKYCDSKEFVSNIFNRKFHPIAKDSFLNVSSSNRKELFDSQGKVKFRLPENTVYTKESDSDLIPFVIKKNGEPKFDDWKYRTGYLNLDGKVVIKPKFLEADSFKNDLAVVTASFANGRPHVGIIDKSGEYFLRPDYNEIIITKQGNFIVGKAPDFLFSTADWKSEVEAYPKLKESAFKGLLREYDLIGMSRESLSLLLDRPKDVAREDTKNSNELFYTVEMTGCANQHRWVDIQFENNKVKRWAYVQGPFHGPNWQPDWNDQNVVFSYEPVRKFDWTDTGIKSEEPKAFLKSEALKPKYLFWFFPDEFDVY
ncbi:WG repeat-containing protein [bacterium]|nr:WG repeat-containing protein [bacterium]QQR58141.1 MAG: WG repeat-containing protein [Candidatus Melainabacteria bacterium]